MAKQTETADVEKKEKCKGEQQALEKQIPTEAQHVHDGDSDDDLAAWDISDRNIYIPFRTTCATRSLDVAC